MQIPQLQQADGYTIPQLGFGTFKVAPEVATRTVLEALELGYRHIDTAQMYRNEPEVGQAIVESGIAREDIYLTTKLNNSQHAPDDARRSFEKSLQDLRTDYVDLFLIHWPLPMHYDGDFPGTWRVLQEFVANGRARSVGVSNFQISHLQRLADEVGVLPQINQIEAHPYFANNEVRSWCQEHNILVEAWSPLARGGAMLDDPELAAVAGEVSRTPAQVALRWALQRGDIIFPKSLHRERMQENLNLFDFELDQNQMARIDSLDQGEAGRSGSHPDKMDMLGR